MSPPFRWLLGGAVAAIALVTLGLLLRPGLPGSAHPARPAICEMNEFCDSRAPEPVDLHPAPLAQGDPDHDLVSEAAGGGTIQVYLPTAMTPAPPDHLFLVGGSDLVIVRNMPGGRHALLLRRAEGLGRLRVRTDAGLSLARFALLRPDSGSGDTFVLEQPAGSGRFAYRTIAPDSSEIRAQWLAEHRSTCGIGPLTAVPPQWARDYEALCRPAGAAQPGG